jgi:Uma2 family endonuclease
MLLACFLPEKGRVEMTTVERASMALPADWVPGPEQGSWTYDEYASLPDDGQRYEIVNGVLVMAPAPDGPHQDAVLRIAHYLLMHVEFAGLGKVRVALFDVQLSAKDVFQPDVFVVLNVHLSRMQKKKMIGAPDLTVEVASPSTALLDRVSKYEKYAEAGVQEYWIVNVEAGTVQVSVLEAGGYRSLGIFRGKQTIPSRVVANLPVRVEQFFS